MRYASTSTGQADSALRKLQKAQVTFSEEEAPVRLIAALRPINPIPVKSSLVNRIFRYYLGVREFHLPFCSALSFPATGWLNRCPEKPVRRQLSNDHHKVVTLPNSQLPVPAATVAPVLLNLVAKGRFAADSASFHFTEIIAAEAVSLDGLDFSHDAFERQGGIEEAVQAYSLHHLNEDPFLRKFVNAEADDFEREGLFEFFERRAVRLVQPAYEDRIIGGVRVTPADIGLNRHWFEKPARLETEVLRT